MWFYKLARNHLSHYNIDLEEHIRSLQVSINQDLITVSSRIDQNK